MKQAFTLIELIFVIVLISILGASAMFYFHSSDNEIAQAANQLARHIRYTQHLALMDDRFDPSDNEWYKGRWRIRFSKSTLYPQTNNYVYYSVFSDSKNPATGYGGFPDTASELAIDPYDKQKLGTNTSGDKTKITTNLVNKYNTDFSSDCGVLIAFDSLGRPYNGIGAGAYANLLTENCTITLRHLDTGDTGTITIHPETGLVTVSY